VRVGSEAAIDSIEVRPGRAAQAFGSVGRAVRVCAFREGEMIHPKRRKRSTRRAARKESQTPEHAAEVFVRNLLRQVCGDFLDLVEDEVHDRAARERDYANLKLAVRRQHQLPIHDLDRLRANLFASIPPDHLQILRAAVDDYVDAVGDELIVQENAAYILGVAVGRTFGPKAQLRDP
jgi:hypothetical protein